MSQDLHLQGQIFQPGKNFDKFAQGLEYLAGGEYQVGAAPTSIGPVFFPARDVLMVIFRASSLSAADQLAFRFNEDAGANYWDRNLAAAVGGATFAETATNTSTMIRAGRDLGTLPRIGILIVMNKINVPKPVTCQVAMGTGAAATVGDLQFGNGEWVNTTAPITSMTMLSAGGTATFGVDTGLGVFGKDLP